MKRKILFVFPLLFFVGCDLFDIYHSPRYKAQHAIGVNCHLPDDSTLTLMENMGVEWIRMSINWRLIEPVEGERFWDFVDDRVNAAHDRGFRIYMTVWETPEWASPSGLGNAVPSDSAYFREFMEVCVARYRDRIEFWGLWNEPNGGEYFSGSPSEFREMVFKPGARGVKNADPDAYVVGPGITVHTGWDQWMREIADDDVKDMIDIVGLHLYVTGSDRDLFYYINYSYGDYEDIPPIMDVIDNLGLKRKDLWLEETGWMVEGPHAVSEEEQAEYIQNLCWQVFGNPYVFKCFIYEMIDDPDTPAGEPRYGLLRDDYTPRESYRRVQEFLEFSPMDE